MTAAENERDAVRRGALVLDQVVPGWHNRVDLKKLKMSSGQLCMLGQLFGQDAETAIAKEMYPELWAKHKSEWNDGYMIGCRMIPKLLGIKSEDIDYAQNEDAEAYALGRACQGSVDSCSWAEEVANRRAQEENSNG